MKILLVNPATAGIFKEVGRHLPPRGLLYLGACSEQNGYQIEILGLGTVFTFIKDYFWGK
jgi:hypothetical protein